MMTILKEKECKEILGNHYIGNIAYISSNSPHIVPMTYYFDGEDTILGYSSEGHKTKAMRNNNNVSLHIMEMKDIDNWTSVLAHGTYEEIDGANSKGYLRQFAKGIKNLISQREERNLHFISEFSSKIYKEEIPVVFKIKVDQITGRQRIH